MADLSDPKILLLAVQNADLLRCIGAQDRPQTGSQIAAAVGRDKSNVHKSLAKLGEAGLLQADHGGLSAAGRELLPRLDALEGKAQIYPQGGTPASAASDLTTLTHAEIEPDRENPRKAFDIDAMAALKADLRQRHEAGRPPVLQNLVVHKGHGGKLWMLAAGERRWRAIGELIAEGVMPADLPIPVRKLVLGEAFEARDRLLIAASENLQRANLNRIEEGGLYQSLVDAGVDTQEIADRVNRSRRHVQQHMQLLDLSPEDLARVKSGELGFKAALELLQDHRTPPAAPPPAAPSDAGASEARTEGVGADNAAASVPTGEGAAVSKPDAVPSKDRDHLQVSGAAPAPSAAVSFSTSSSSGSSRGPDPAALAAALDTAQVLHLAEIGWAVRIAGAFKPGLGGGRLARAVPAARANEDATTRRLVNGTGLPDLLAFWMAPGHGPLLALSEPGRQALKHVAPALGNLDAPEREAFAELDALRAAAGVSETDRKALAERELSTVTWLNPVLSEALKGVIRERPDPLGRADGPQPGAMAQFDEIIRRGTAPEPIFALYAGDVVRITGGAHYRLIGALSRDAGEAEACGFLAQQIRKSRRGKGEGTDYGEPRQLTLSAIEELLERGTPDPEATTNPEEEAA